MPSQAIASARVAFESLGIAAAPFWFENPDHPTVSVINPHEPPSERRVMQFSLKRTLQNGRLCASAIFLRHWQKPVLGRLGLRVVLDHGMAPTRFAHFWNWTGLAKCGQPLAFS